jgi:hypothetical protein
MLSWGDEYPIHQTAEPVAYAGSDRNFYDRYFFNGYNADGSIFFGGAFGIYPHLNIMDGAISILKDGRQSSVFLSRPLGMERMDTRVGGLSVEVLEPMKQIALKLEETEGIAADLVFTGRAFPIEEPRFTHRQGPRMLIDCTRMTQNGSWNGWLRIDGETIAVDGQSWRGTRDRSWGVRPVGMPDPQPVPPETLPQFYWIWTPLNFADRAVYFHVNDDAKGIAWNTRAKLVMDGAGQGEDREMEHCSARIVYANASRRVASAQLTFTDPQGRGLGVDLAPLQTFQMKGLGYGHPTRRHGGYHGGELSTVREDFRPAELAWNDPENLHIQAISRAVLTDEDGARHEGIGSLEQMFIGPHAPSGWSDILDA